MTIKNISQVVIVAMGISMLTSCHIYKKFEIPQDDESSLMSEYANAKESEVDSTAFGNLQWREVFTDPILVDLIDQALANNLDLQNAKLNIDVAHAQLKGARMNFIPSVTFAPNGGGSVARGGHVTWTYQIPVSVSWEIDIFGKLLNSKRSAQAALLQSEAYYQAVRSQLIGAVANCYYTIASLERQLKLSEETKESWGESVEVMKNLKLAGRVDESAVVQSMANYYSVCASIPDIEISLNEANNTMSLLLNDEKLEKRDIPATVITVPEIARDGIPMRELAARPDVREAEQELAVAYYATNQARAAFYPGLTITADGGFTNAIGSAITNPGKFFLDFAASLVIPLFNGSNIANLEATKAQQQQAMNNFEYTLLNASAEVSEALITLQKSEEKSEFLEKQTENLEKAVEYTQELLSLSESTTYLEVLTAQQSLLSSQISQISCDLNKAEAVINLYQALGGGR